MLQNHTSLRLLKAKKSNVDNTRHRASASYTYFIHYVYNNVFEYRLPNITGLIFSFRST